MGQREQRERHRAPQPISITRAHRSFMEYRLSNYPASFKAHLCTAGTTCENSDDVWVDRKLHLCIYYFFFIVFFSFMGHTVASTVCAIVGNEWSARIHFNSIYQFNLQEQMWIKRNTFTVCLSFSTSKHLLRNSISPLPALLSSFPSAWERVCHKGWTLRTVNGGDLIH